MFIENLLTASAAQLTKRYLTLQEYSSDSFPANPNRSRPYLLYIHIPFCEELCPYCSFVRIKFEKTLAARYFDSLRKEIEAYHRMGYSFDSIYIGGGTPTIAIDELAKTVSLAKSLWPIKRLSVETNPNHLVADKLGILKELGTNRLSVGVQSFNDEILESISRLKKYGSGDEIKAKLINTVGMFDTLNADMIFNFPNQSDQRLLADIETIKEIKTDQVTYYPLMISKVRKKNIAQSCGAISFKKEKRLYKLVVDQLTSMYSQETIWCFSDGRGSLDEYIVDHDEYAGTGAGAFGYINGVRYFNTFSVQQYVDMIQSGRCAIIGIRKLQAAERARFYFLMKLFAGSMSITDAKAVFGNRFWLYLCREMAFLAATRSATFGDGRITLTHRGQYYWMVLMRTLFSVLGDVRERYTDTSLKFPLFRG